MTRIGTRICWFVPTLVGAVVLAVAFVAGGSINPDPHAHVVTAGLDLPIRDASDSDLLDVEVTDIPVPSSGHAGEPFLTHDADGHILASWVERHDETARLMWSRLDDQSWTDPHEIASGDDWFVNWADVPSIAVHSSGVMAAHWLQRLGSGRYAYGVRISLSQDGGATWSKAGWLHEDRSATEHGFVSLTAIHDGFMAVWLDGHAYADERREMSIHSRIISLDGSLGDEVAIDARVCDCCPTEIAQMEDGSLLSLYRDRSEGEQRDIAFSRFDGSTWSQTAPLHEDAWMIEACPVNGPAADVMDDTLVAAWFTMASGSAEVYWAFASADQARSSAADSEPLFESARLLTTKRPAGRVDLIMESDNSALLLWLEGGEPDVAGLYVSRIHADGHQDASFRVAETSSSRAVGMPRLVKDEAGFVAMWTLPGETRDDPAQLRSARLTIPD